MSKPARLTETSVGTLVAVVGDADRFDFIYIAYADPKDGNIRRIDIQQALRGN